MSVLLALTTALPASAALRTFTGLALTGNGQGYILVSSAGEFYAFGEALPQANPSGFSGQIADVAVTADGRGAMAVSSAGQFYAFGTARPQPNPVGFSGQIVGVALTADGQGAMAVSSAGQFYAYGTARSQPNPVGFSGTIRGLDLTADGQGAVAVSSVGQLYAYGTARSQPNPTGFTGQVVGVDLTADGQGLTAMSSSGQVYAYGTARYWANGDPGSATTSPQASAQALLNNRNVVASNTHVATGDDGATALRNLQQVAAGGQARRSSYGNAPGGTTPVSTPMMQALASIGGGHSFRISEIAGGSHSVGSTHYNGRSVDIDRYDGQLVAPRSNFAGLVTLCQRAGANVVYSPSNDPDGSHKNHVHCQWAS